MSDFFEEIILIGRPAAGKSEILDYLRRTESEERLSRFHVGNMVEIDDFPMLWAWFEEDRILAEMGKPRLHTDDAGYFSHNYLWDVLIRRIELEYHKLGREAGGSTVFLEFSRGMEHGGFERAFGQFSKELLSRAVVFYIDVSYEESLRKNRKRFNPDRPHSILEHGLPDEKLERLYGENDWNNLVKGDSRWLSVKGIRIPYVIFPNEDDVTTTGGALLGKRLEEVMGKLWMIEGTRY